MAYKGKKKPEARKSSGGWDAPEIFQRATAAVKPRLLMAVRAREKRGKTNFGLTGPGPLAILHTDMGLDGVVQKFQVDKEIHVATFDLDIDAKNTEGVKAAAQPLWEEWVDTYAESLRRKVRTLLVDTWSEACELGRLAEFGKLDHVKPHHYGPLNAKWRKLFKMGMNADSNIIFLQRMKEEYEGDSPTGGYKPAGFKDTGYEVHVVIDLDRDEEDGTFLLKIVDCRHSPEANGIVLKGDDCTFQKVAGLVMPDVDEGEWE